MIYTKKIESTRDYKIFKKLKQNRPLNKGHVFRLTNAIVKDNLLEFNPILVNKNMEVVDGQHRLEVAKNNDLEIYYMITDNEGFDELITQNINVLPWKMEEYLHYWISMGREDYQKLKEFKDSNNIGVSLAMVLLTGKLNSRDHSPMHDFKLGQFKITHQELADDLISKMAEVTPFTTSNLLFDPSLWSALNIVIQKGDWDRFVTKLNSLKPRIVREVGVSQYLFMFEEIYNYHIPEANRFHFR